MTKLVVRAITLAIAAWLASSTSNLSAQAPANLAGMFSEVANSQTINSFTSLVAPPRLRLFQFLGEVQMPAI
jgi:hypothetical protein